MKQSTLYLERQMRVYKHTWRASIFSTFLTPVLMLVALGVGLGSLVDDRIDGFEYLVWIGPGLMAATAMNEGAGQGAYPVFAGMKWIKSYDAALATPLQVRHIVGGHVMWVTFRLLIQMTMYALALVVVGASGVLDALQAIGPSVLTGLAFGGIVMAYTATIETEVALASIFRFGTTPLFLFSGTFFPISQLPDNIEWLKVLAPTWHGVELARAASLGVESGLHLLIHVTVLATLAVFGFVLAHRNLERRLIS